MALHDRALQRFGTHRVLGRGQPSAEIAREHRRARVVKHWRAVAELGGHATLHHV